MIVLSKKIVFYILLLTSTFLFAQYPVSVHLTEKDGLPDTEFYDIIEDDTGLIWLAADNGLFKYDGANYTSFTHPKQIGLSVFQLQKDDDNVIWYTNIANQVFYLKNDTVTLFGDFKKDFNGILTTMLLHKNFLILFTRKKVIILDRKTNEILFEQNLFKDKEGSDIFYVIEPVIVDNKLFFGDRLNNFHAINLKDFSTTYKKVGSPYHKTKLLYSLSGSIYFKNQIIYYSTYINTEDNRKTFYSVPINLSSKATLLKTVLPDIVIISTQMFNNLLWVVTENGVYVCDVINNELKIVQHLFKNKFITRVIQDINKNYWFTTLNDGVYVVPNIEINKINIPLETDKISKVFLGDNQELILTSFEKKMIRYNVKSKKTDVLFFSKNETLYYIKFDQFQNKYLIFLRDIVEVRNKELKAERIFAQSASTKKIEFINKSRFIHASSNTIRESKIIDSKVVAVFNNDIRGYTCFYDHKNKKSYFGTIEGLYRYDENWTKKEIKFQDKSIFINDITQTTDGRLWCNSFKNGIYTIESDTAIKHYTTDNGLLSNKNTFIRSKDNTIWLAGEKGVQKLNTHTEIFKNLTKQNGIPSYSFNGLEIIDNNVYVSTPDLLYSFNSEKVFQSKKILDPYFTSITINGNTEKLKSKYILTHQQKKINIAFNSNGFLSKNSVEYSYRLLGSTDKWEKTPSGLNQVNFISLSPGDYEFQLKASNGSDVSQIKKINFTIKGVFYNQWWFYVSISLLTIGLFWLYFRQVNIRLKEKQHLFLEKQDKELENVFLKLESLRSQMNPHFIFNALNSIQDYIIHNDQKLARKYLVKFSRLIRIYLEHSQQDVVSLKEEIDALQLYLDLEKDRFEDSFEFTLNMDKRIITDHIQIPTFLMQPYVENAIKHGLLHKKTNRILSVSFSLNDEGNILKCIINDNGIGREASAKLNAKRIKPKSFSSEANQKRINLLNKTRVNPITLNTYDDYNEYNIAIGTSVILKIPILKLKQK